MSTAPHGAARRCGCSDPTGSSESVRLSLPERGCSPSRARRRSPSHSDTASTAGWGPARSLARPCWAAHRGEAEEVRERMAARRVSRPPRTLSGGGSPWPTVPSSYWEPLGPSIRCHPMSTSPGITVWYSQSSRQGAASCGFATDVLMTVRGCVVRPGPTAGLIPGEPSRTIPARFPGAFRGVVRLRGFAATARHLAVPLRGCNKAFQRVAFRIY